MLKTHFFYGYIIVMAGFTIQMISSGAMYTYGVFFHEFQAEFGWSRALISGASSLSFLMWGVGAVTFGTLNDRIGPKIILSASGFCMGVGFMLMSQLDMPWQLYFLYGIVVGIGLSTPDVITLSTITRWFIKYRGMMSGFVKAGTGAGQFLIPMSATVMITTFGWRNTYLVMGGTSALLLVVLAQLMKRDPQVIGLLPDGNRKGAHCSLQLVEENGLSLKSAVRTKHFWMICIAEFTLFFCLMTIIIHIVPHARDLGIQPPLAAAVLGTIGGASMFSRIIMGSASDRIGGKRSLIIGFIMLISSIIWLQVAHQAWTLFTFAIIYGFAHGVFFTVMSPTIAEFFGTGSHGQLFGIVLFSGTIGGSIGPVIAGYLFDMAGNYGAAFKALNAFALIGLVLIIFLRPLDEDSLKP